MAANHLLRKLNPLAFTEYGELKSLKHQLLDMRSADEYSYPFIVCSESRMISVTIAVHCNASHSRVQVNRIATIVARDKEEDFLENTLRRLVKKPGDV